MWGGGGGGWELMSAYRHTQMAAGFGKIRRARFFRYSTTDHIQVLLSCVTTGSLGETISCRP